MFWFYDLCISKDIYYDAIVKDKESHKEIIHNLENLLKLEKTDEAADSDAELYT